MIKFMMTTEAGRKVLGIMISEGNVEKLKGNQPIHFHAEQMGLPEIKFQEMIIVYYPTEEAFKAAFEKDGLITSETIIHTDDEQKH